MHAIARGTAAKRSNQDGILSRSDIEITTREHYIEAAFEIPHAEVGQDGSTGIDLRPYEHPLLRIAPKHRCRHIHHICTM